MLTKRLLPAVLVILSLGWMLSAADPDLKGVREEAQKARDAGNFKDAFESYRKLAVNPQDDPKLVGEDLQQGIQCLQRLGRNDEVDAFRDQVVEVHKENWRLLQAAGQSYLYGEHYGFIVAGKFSRGNQRGGGKYVSSQERDRVLGLRLFDQALALIKDEEDKAAAAQFFIDFAAVLQSGGESWRLQVLTDLKELPDYSEVQYYGRRWRGGGGSGASGAPVDAEGDPVFHHLPAGYAEAQSDGEKWRWALSQAAEMDAKRLNDTRLIFANFLQQEFGVQTMGGYQPRQSDDGQPEKTGTFALHTLTEKETIARLATGVRRFTLPDEFNPIVIFRTIAADGKSAQGEQALNRLAQIFSDRRQYPKAAGIWKENIAQYGPGDNNYKQLQLDQIIKNWCQFENVLIQPGGTGATVDLRFRNATRVEFEAREIKVPQLLEDIKAYLKSSPAQLDWNKMNIGGIGYMLVQQNQEQYLGEKVANWGLDLEPAADHFDRRITVTTPLQKSGAYLLTAQVKDGNVSRIIVWLSDLVIAKKQLDNRAYYYVAEAVSGKPVPKANLEFFGWQQERVGNTRNFRIKTSQFADVTDADGQAMPDPKLLQTNFQWIVIARTAGDVLGRAADQRFAHLGFSGVWYGQNADPAYNQNKVFLITDRPVYRPKQTVKFKIWVRKAQYDQPERSDFANQEFQVLVNNPKGEQFSKKAYTTDAYGGIEGELELPVDATLGHYYILIADHPQIGGGGSFRVEEYKKPEFQVTVEAPTEPVKLGDKITAVIQAKYYFGAPVSNAKVKYKVQRTSYTERWHPVGKWDWFYGRGYWWFAADYDWYPGFTTWGCRRPYYPWWPGPTDPPEIVSEQEVEIPEDGRVEVEIDTAVAKEMHGDLDHSYSITAEVTDESRRTITGLGNVLVARKPFKVFVWVNRGHYQVGDTIEASVSAHTLAQKPVTGKGILRLLKITYNDKGEPVETEVQNWALDPTEEGTARQQLKASEPGQYRLSYQLTDQKEQTEEGGYIFVVRGEGFTGSEFRFNDLELITDKKEYAVGETVKVMLNTNRTDSTVLLFIRPANGIYSKPKVIRLKGKSTVEEVAVVTRDMPNFFLEAVTISGGKVHSETREVVVPPESRVLNVTVTPSQAEFLPGAEAKVGVKLTDQSGKPFVGTTVLTMYDKSVEYISGGSNVPEIREFFWKWRRNHYPQTEHNFNAIFGNLLRQGETGMSYLGAFGYSVADDERSLRKSEARGAALSAAAPPAAPGLYRSEQLKSHALADGRQSDRQAEAEEKDKSGGAADPDVVEPTVRSNFADTAYWAGALSTNENGEAEISLKMPENLTGWRIKTWAMGHGTKVGQGEAEVVTTKNLLVRMQAPRFFVETDEVVLSANVHNYLKVEKPVRVILEVDGPQLSPMAATTQQIVIPAGGEKRVDWRVKVAQEGEAVIRMKALTDEESDAMEMRFPVYIHGMLKTESFSGVVRPNQETGSVTFTVPKERRINESRLEVRYSPSLAGAMVDALPYLVSYPHKTTDTTLTRFLPTVITQNILLKMKVDLKAIKEKRTNLNAQEIGDPQARAQQWKRWDDQNPVFDPDEVKLMVQLGVKTITEMQLSDGGWGWFSGYGEQSWPHTTAQVVHGLQVAQANDIALVPGMLDRGVEWLKQYQARQVEMLKNAPTKTKPYKTQADNLDALVYMVLGDANIADAEMREFLYRDRTKLSVYGMAMFGLALQKQGQAEQLAMILKNISQYLVEDAENQTAYLKLPNENYWWYWYGNDIEANAYYLKLLSKTEPQSPQAAGLVKYLLNNRKHATYWNSTRDTALCIEALADYMTASGEDQPDLTIEVWLDGEKRKDVKVTSENLFTFDGSFVLEGDGVTDGEHTLEIRKQGKGPVYFNAYLTNFSLEEFITKAGLEIKVQRKFYKLIRDDKTVNVAGSRGQAVGQRVEKYRREEIANLGEVKSGELVEVELEIDSKNDYEYLLFEDKKAAGFEPVEVRSGYNGNDLGAYVEFRDDRVVFFARTLARGKHSVKYRLHAEIPGQFSALPALGSGMYAPELKANSDEMKISIVE